MPAPSRPWAVVVPVKGGSSAVPLPTRPGPPWPRPSRSTPSWLRSPPWASSESSSSRPTPWWRPWCVRWIRQPPGGRSGPRPGVGLDAAARAGVDRARAEHFHRVAVLLGDHLSLTSTELRSHWLRPQRTGCLRAGRGGHGDRHGGPSPLPTDDDELRGSAARHAAWPGPPRPRPSRVAPRCRRSHRPRSGPRRGRGPAHGASVAGYPTIVQATIHSTGDEGGQALLDDGSLIDWDPADCGRWTATPAGRSAGQCRGWMMKTGGHAGCGSSASARAGHQLIGDPPPDQVVIGADGVQLRREVLVTSIDQGRCRGPLRCPRQRERDEVTETPRRSGTVISAPLRRAGPDTTAECWKLAREAARGGTQTVAIGLNLAPISPERGRESQTVLVDGLVDDRQPAGLRERHDEGLLPVGHQGSDASVRWPGSDVAAGVPEANSRRRCRRSHRHVGRH